MFERVARPMLFGAYQLSILVGILLLPIALLVGRLGITLPVHRVVQALEAAYDRYVDST